jgi:hypothetical protein
MRLIAFLVCSLGFMSLNAQTLSDAIFVNYTLMPNSYKQGDNATLGINNFEVNAVVPPIKIGKRVQIFNGLYYRYTHFNSRVRQGDIGYDLTNTLHDARCSLIVSAKLTERWGLLGIGRLVMRSDLQSRVSGRDFFPFGLLLATYTIKTDPLIRVGFGAVVTSDFGYNSILPFATLRYESSKIKLEVIYPNLNLVYKKSDSFEFGLFAAVEGAIFRVAERNEAHQVRFFQKNIQILVAPTFTHRIYKQIYGHLKVGVIPYSTFDQWDSNYEVIPSASRATDPSLFIRTGIS